MASGVAISDVLFIPRAFAEVEARRAGRKADDKRRSRVACVGNSASGMFFKAPEFRRSQKTRFVEIKQSPRSSLVIVSMCQDKAEIMAAQELADGSIFFSFGDKPTASDAEKEEAAFLTPSERLLISRIDLPKRWPSQFKKQLPYLVISGTQRAPESISVQKCPNSNALNQNHFGLIGEARHGPCRYPSFFVKKSPVPSSKVCELSDFPISGCAFGRESGKDHYSPNRLPSKFVKKSPIPCQLLVYSVPRMRALLHYKHPETANQENVGKSGSLSSRLPSKFVKQSPIPSSLVAVLTGLPANKNKLDGPPAGLATTTNRSLTSARSNTDGITLEDVKFHEGSKKIDHLHPKSHSRAVLSSGENDQKRVLKNIKQDLRPSEVGMVDDEMNSGGLKEDDHLTFKGFPNTRRVNEDISNVLDELTRSDAAPTSSISRLVEKHQRAPTRHPSNFVRVLPIASAVRPKKVQSNNIMSERHGIHNPSQSVLKKPPSPTTCSPESQQSHVASDDKASKGASVKNFKNNKKSGTDENGKTNTTEGNFTLKVTESGCSSTSITRPSSSTQKYPDYSQYTVSQLKMLAKSLHLKGYSKLRKQGLLELLRSADR